MTKLAPEWVRTSDPVIRSPARYRWTTAPALIIDGSLSCNSFLSRYWYYYSIVFYICLYSQCYAGAIVMLTGVHTSPMCDWRCIWDSTMYGLYHLTDIVYLWYNLNLCRIVFRIL